MARRGRRALKMERVDLGRLGLDQGGYLLVKRALRRIEPGGEIAVHGDDPRLALHLRAWCRAQGLGFRDGEGTAGDSPVAYIRSDSDLRGRWVGAEAGGAADFRIPGAIREAAPAHWGLAPRGSFVEAGVPPFAFPISERETVWTDDAADIYARAAAAQWDPERAVDWGAPFELPEEVEDAVVQVMTYLIENETAALLIPARFLAMIHPHFREVLQVLAIQAADEARHIEVFTRRALLRRKSLGLSTAGGQISLKTLIDEPDFAQASFLLSVLGEGSFLSLLRFLHEHAPDPITRRIALLAGQDEARHVAFGLAHLTRHIEHDPGLRGRLRSAVEQRHEALRHTAGLNEEVFDALILIAAGSWEPEAIAEGHRRVLQLQDDMDRGRRGRLRKLGFSEDDAASLSELHTRNFM